MYSGHRESDAYRDTVVGAMRSYVTEHGGDNIAGDPVKIAHAIYDLTQLPEPTFTYSFRCRYFCDFTTSISSSSRDIRGAKGVGRICGF